LIKRSKNKKVLFRLIKWIILSFVLLSVGIYSLNLGIKTITGFHRLENESIEQVVVYKFVSNSINHKQDSLTLNKVQVNQLVRKWNNTVPIGLVKYIPEYSLTVRMINNKTRHFRTSGNIIKENNDCGYKIICPKNYIKTLWNERK